MWFLRRVSVGSRVGLLAMVAWLAMATAGFYAFEAYEFTPGVMGRTPPDWPEGSALGFVSGRPNVVMAVHPRCPCTRASLDQLEEIVRGLPDRGSLRLLVFRPEGGDPGWGTGSILRSPDQPAAMSWVDDPGGHEAERFGLATSGAVAAYDASGRLRFSGGLMTSRGHGGPSGGSEALAAVLTGREPARTESAVFGCGIIRRSGRRGRR